MVPVREMPGDDQVPGKVMTDRLLDFVITWPARWPKDTRTRFSSLSYTEAPTVPSKVMPEPNVRVMYCPYPMDWAAKACFLRDEHEGDERPGRLGQALPQAAFIFDYSVSYRSTWRSSAPCMPWPTR